MDSKFFTTAIIAGLCISLAYSSSLNATSSEVKAKEEKLPLKLNLTIAYKTTTPAPSTTTPTPAPSKTTTTPAPSKTTTTPAPSNATTTPAPSNATTTPAPSNATTTPTPSNATTTPAPSNATTTPAPSNATTTPAPSSATTTPAPSPTKITTPGTEKHSTPAPFVNDRQFDGPSFIGGIVLTVGLTAIGFIAFKYFRASRVGKEPDYRHL